MSRRDMVDIRRRTLLAAGIATPSVLAGCGPRSRGSIVWRLATKLAASHPLNLRLAEAVRRVGLQSGGRLRIDLYPGGQLGSDTDMLSQLRAGAIQMQSISGLV